MEMNETYLNLHLQTQKIQCAFQHRQKLSFTNQITIHSYQTIIYFFVHKIYTVLYILYFHFIFIIFISILLLVVVDAKAKEIYSEQQKRSS